MSPSISTPGVIDRVSSIFRGHPGLIMGFNTFLPPGYRIESTNNPDDPICVITPQDQPPYYPHPSSFQAVLPPVSQISGFNYVQDVPASLPPISSLGVPTSMLPGGLDLQPLAEGENIPPEASVSVPIPPAPAPAPRLIPPEHRAPVEFNHAINYVNKIKVCARLQYSHLKRTDSRLSQRFTSNSSRFFRLTKRNKSLFKRCVKKA